MVIEAMLKDTSVVNSKFAACFYLFSNIYIFLSYMCRDVRTKIGKTSSSSMFWATVGTCYRNMADSVQVYLLFT